MVYLPKPPRCPAHSTTNTGGCPGCRRYSTGMESRRRRLKMYGLFDTGLVSAGECRRHIAKLKAAGMSYPAIAAEAGFTYKTLIQKIATGKAIQVREYSARKILSVPVPEMRQARRGHVIATGTRRRTQALVAMGYGYEAQSRMRSCPRNNIWRLATGAHQSVTVETEAEVRSLYDKLSMTPCSDRSATKARNVAKRMRWAPPLAWDDDAIDDPKAKPDFGNVQGFELPDESAIQLALSGQRDLIGRPLNNAEKRIAIERAFELGKSDRETAALVGIARGSVCATRLRMRWRAEEAEAET